MKNFFKYRWKIFASLFFLILLVYANSLNGAFLSDDIAGISENPYLGTIKYVALDKMTILRQTIFAVTFALFGKTPALFHIINIFFHFGVCSFIYLILEKLTSRRAGIFASLLFAVHPLLTESVSWISGGVYVQYSFFVLLAFYLFLLFEKSKNKWFFLSSIISFVAALFSSEKAIVFPVILLSYLLYQKTLKKYYLKLIPFFGISFTWGIILLGKIGNRLNVIQESNFRDSPALNPLKHGPISIFNYLKLFIFPKDLSFYHTEMNFTSGQYALFAFVTIVFFASIAYFFFKRKEIFFWLSFFILSISPTMLPISFAWVVAERYVYLGIVSLSALTGIIFAQLDARNKIKWASRGVFATIIIIFAVRTVVRNIDWHNMDNLWIATAKTAPSSFVNHNNLGDMYARHGNYEMAITEFQKAVELNPVYASAYHNIGNVYVQMSKTEEAIESYQKAIEIAPGLWQSNQNLAVLFYQEGKYQEAVDCLVKAISANPQNSLLFSNLGITYQQLGNKEEAAKAYEEALRLNPSNTQAQQGLQTLR
ncbi:hypothetical protein COT51_03000 [candidate division WWE3 bacterium CG08_land_8_20_14_0_20_41_15]|uniref:Glycosyltransferase RgtA/B/C/D-like domain-containing protein n=1 Tax=candidate division WWE3 bacterium CG08_land_8_20_14_0_20_41_15 TaxID=1975086 RepID=A0A2H0X916_UNCKA|nr:MAG: hypothetical protein COT51_03000 [candidate division WWE3 bacterium CG08_land_8_20_14_0_20_41_15]